MDPAIVGTMRVGHFRIGVFRDDWDNLVKRVESVSGPISLDVTRRELTLGTPDYTTGWYAKEWSDSTIQGILSSRSATHVLVAAGTYARTDYLLLTKDVVEESDEIKDASGNYYEVKPVRLRRIGDSFSHRECDLTHLPLHSLSYSSSTPSVEDARSRTKTYWETYLDYDKLQNKSFIVAYSNPDYSLTRVFLDKEIDIIFAVNQSSGTPMMDPVSQAPYGYVESVPTDVQALDPQLMHLGGAELRRITESYPGGSKRNLETMRPTTIRLGSHTVYSQRHILNYRRDTT